MRSSLERKEVTGHIRKLVDTLFGNIPSGVGSKRKDLRLSHKELKKVLAKGAGWAVKQGFGYKADLEFILNDRSFEELRRPRDLARMFEDAMVCW